MTFESLKMILVWTPIVILLLIINWDMYYFYNEQFGNGRLRGRCRMILVPRCLALVLVIPGLFVRNFVYFILLILLLPFKILLHRREG